MQLFKRYITPGSNGFSQKENADGKKQTTWGNHIDILHVKIYCFRSEGKQRIHEFDVPLQ